MELPENGKNVIEGSSVPIVITHHTVKRAPKIEVSKKFVGIGAGIKRLITGLAIKAIETVDEAFWSEERTVLDKGDVRSVHYALDVETDETNPDTTAVIATKLDQDRPACGAHYQVVRIESQDKDVLEAPMPVVDEEGNNIVRAKATAPRPVPRNMRAPKVIRNPSEE